MPLVVFYVAMAMTTCCDVKGLFFFRQRKKLVLEKVDESGGSKSVKQLEEKLKQLRKKNADLVSLAKSVDDKYKALKLENEQLVCGCHVCTMWVHQCALWGSCTLVCVCVWISCALVCGCVCEWMCV